MNPIVSIVAGVLKPLAELVDSLHTSEQEKGQIRVALAAAHVEFAAKVLDYEARMIEAQSSIIKAEATGASWLQRTWRPITMLTFLGLVVFDSFGWLPFRLAGEAWTLLQIGLGGYVAGRSAEKVVPMIAGAMRESSAKS
jgi:hypothetical protein